MSFKKERKEGRKKKKTKYKCLNKEGMSNNMGRRILGRSEGRSWGRMKTSPSAQTVIPANSKQMVVHRFLCGEGRKCSSFFLLKNTKSIEQITLIESLIPHYSLFASSPHLQHRTKKFVQGLNEKMHQCTQKRRSWHMI